MAFSTAIIQIFYASVRYWSQCIVLSGQDFLHYRLYCTHFWLYSVLILQILTMIKQLASYQSWQKGYNIRRLWKR
jgi:hypothetical protein